MIDDRYSNIYIELDCLMDTRIGTILTYYGEKTAIDVINNGYSDREYDEFYNIDYDEFNSIYKSRDKNVLFNSIRTNLIYLINDLIQETIKNNIGSPIQLIPKITLNIHPYELMDKEIELIKLVLAKTTNRTCDIEIVNLDYSSLTPNFFGKETTVAFMYDYHLWLEAQALNKNLDNKACPHLNIITPRLYKKKLTKKDRQIHSELGDDPFQYVVDKMRIFVELGFMPVSLFNVPAMPKKEEAA